MISKSIKTTEDMETLGKACAKFSKLISSIYLLGGLGAGKTTFCRGFIQALGHNGAVKSPTYTLVESYQLNQRSIYHFDLYRVNHIDELEAMGIRDYFNRDNLCILEWPEKAQGFLSDPDLMFTLDYEGEGRIVHIKALSDEGAQFVCQLDPDIAP